MPCNSIVLSEFHLPWYYTHKVRADSKHPARNKERLRGYQYTIIQDFSIDL